jgi:hypothetical protein
MAGLWINDEATPEGKFLVVRRDGTIPDWPHFVMGARDPFVPPALRAYADEAERGGADPAFAADVRALAMAFERYCAAHGEGDPDAPRHRRDDLRVIDAMRRGGHLFDGAKGEPLR